MQKSSTGKFIDLAVKKSLGEVPEDIGFSSNIFMVFGLPTRRLEKNPAYWVQETSLCRLTVMRHERYEVPYGCYARINQIFIDTEVRTKSTNVIDLGRSFNEYVKKTGHKEGGANKALLRQLVNYVTSVLRVEPTNPGQGRLLGIQSVVARAWDIFFDVKNPEQLMLSTGQIVLNEDYARYVHAHSVPLDMHVVRCFKRSPLALDFYRFLAYRNNGLRKTTAFPERLLFEQLGTEQLTDRVTRSRLRKILRTIQLYWEVQAKFEDGYFELEPSPPAVEQRTRRGRQLQVVDKPVEK